MFEHGINSTYNPCASNFPDLKLKWDTFDSMKSSQAEGNLSAMLWDLDFPTRVAIAHWANQTIKSCVFESMEYADCEALINGSTAIVTPQMGVCFSYNYYLKNYTETRQGNMLLYT